MQSVQQLQIAINCIVLTNANNFQMRGFWQMQTATDCEAFGKCKLLLIARLLVNANCYWLRGFWQMQTICKRGFL